MKKIIIHKNMPETDAYWLNYLPQGTLFFDIETTGFSPAKSGVYLIGAAYRNESSMNICNHNENSAGLIIEQYFADSPEDEPKLLSAFSKLLERFGTLTTFHGLGFDIPFLKGRCKKHGITQVYDNRNYVDLYKIFSSYKHIFQLENYKQKTLEKFIGFTREDLYDGGGLTKVYKAYVKKPDDELLHLLLLHNKEDVLGMIKLLSLYSFHSFFDGNFEPASCVRSNYRRLDGSDGGELAVTCRLSEPLPAAISCKNDYYYLHASQAEAVFRIPLYTGTLKYFYPNCRDYYYLPEEDIAVHKSVAVYVDKAHRKKATAATCYSKKTGIFLPQYQEALTPALYAEYKDSVSYFELPENFEKETDMLKRYCMHILETLKAGK